MSNLTANRGYRRWLTTENMELFGPPAGDRANRVRTILEQPHSMTNFSRPDWAWTRGYSGGLQRHVQLFETKPSAHE